MHSQPSDLTGAMLISMPGLGDPRFDHSVIYLCTHSSDGAMGLILNKPTGDISHRMLFEQLKITPVDDAADAPVYYGGPVETGRGFVLHSPDYSTASTTLPVAEGFAMTATMDVLEALAKARGPRQSRVMLGYAGWGPGQLEGELADNAWLTCGATPALVFDTPAPQQWEAALGSIGVAALALSGEGGRA